MVPHSVIRSKTVYYSRLPKTEPAEFPLLIKHAPLFSAALIHEIRNPLTNINLAAEALLLMVTDETQKNFVNMILRAAQKITISVNELAQEQQNEQEEPKKYSIHQLLDEVLLMTTDRIHLKKIQVKKIYCSTGFIKTVNGPVLKIAFTNIIINAIDAMEPDGLLCITTEVLERRFIIHIADNGCGIPADHLQHIFKPYFTSKPDGLGIGLAASIDILKANKIVVRVESEVKIGTTFTLAFPRSRQSAEIQNNI